MYLLNNKRFAYFFVFDKNSFSAVFRQINCKHPPFFVILHQTSGKQRNWRKFSCRFIEVQAALEDPLGGTAATPRWGVN